MLQLAQYNSRCTKATTLRNYQRQRWRWWPTKMATLMADGDGDGNGRWQRRRQPRRQWLTVTQQTWRRQWSMATAMAMVNGNGDGDRVSNNSGDGNGDCNGDGHGKGDNDKGRVASSCAGNVQHYGRGDTLPPPPWTQRKVHLPGQHHGGDTAKSVCSPSRGRVPYSSPWILFLLIIYTYCSVYWTILCSPPHYSGSQEPCQPIDALPPPLLQEPCQPIDNLPQLLLHFLSR